MDRLTEKLKLLRNIVPDDGFTLSTKFSVLSSKKTTSNTNRRFALPNFWPSYAIVATLALLVIFIGDIKPPEVEQSVAEIAAIEVVAASFESDINITLTEIRAYRDSAVKASAALYKASSNDLIHNPTPQKINQLLE